MRSRILISRDPQHLVLQLRLLAHQSRASINVAVRFLLIRTTLHSPHSHPVNLPQDSGPRLHVVHPRPRFPTVIIYSNWLIPPVHRLLISRVGCRSILRLFSVHFAPRNLLEHTISDLIYVLTLMSVPSFVLFAVKLLLGSMTVSDMKDCIAVRRNSYARVTWAQAAAGAVAGGLLVLTHLEDTSEAKQAGFASNHCLTKKPWSGSARTSSK